MNKPEASDQSEPAHNPVLVDEVLKYLDPRAGDRVLDCTFGSGGHAYAIDREIESSGTLVGIDWDAGALSYAPHEKKDFSSSFTFLNGNFADVIELLQNHGIEPLFDGVLADLGWSMDQLREGGRGLTFEKDEYLDMRYHPEAEQSAAEFLRDASAGKLTELFRTHGEHRYGRKLAEEIVSRRNRQPLQRTLQLYDLIKNIVGGSNAKSVAARVFQALRTEVNRELDNLERLLEQMPDLLETGSRGCVISFHSLEDRRVKESFRKGHRQGFYDLLTEKPVRPERDEMEENPSARSARLRAVERR